MSVLYDNYSSGVIPNLLRNHIMAVNAYGKRNINFKTRNK